MFVAGDVVQIGSETVTITGAKQSNGVTYLTVEPALTQSYNKDTEFSTVVQDPINASDRTLLTPVVVDPTQQTPTQDTQDNNNVDDPFSSASSNVVAALMSVILSAFLLF